MEPAPTLLVLGGSGFVGSAVVAAGLDRGWQVTTFNRGRTRQGVAPGVTQLRGDRTEPSTLAPLRDLAPDVVVDTWSGAPVAVATAAEALHERAGRYVYVSSGSVYASLAEAGVAEDAAPVDADPDDPADDDYARAKRGAELAAQRAFGGRALLARAGLILGPGEDVGRLPWWLARMARGGDVLAPGEPQRPLSFVDARDLAGFVLDAATAGLGGPVNVVARRGHATMGSLLTACRDVAGVPGTSLTWVPAPAIARAGIEPWTELPIWLPDGGDFDGLHGMDVQRAHAAGLRCRPAGETVADTWTWIAVAARFTAAALRSARARPLARARARRAGGGSPLTGRQLPVPGDPHPRFAVALLTLAGDAELDRAHDPIAEILVDECPRSPTALRPPHGLVPSTKRERTKPFG